MVLCCVLLYDVVMFLKGMVIHPQLVETQKFSACRHSGYTYLSGFFPRVSKKQLLFCSLQTVFFLLDVFHHKRANLEPYKD